MTVNEPDDAKEPTSDLARQITEHPLAAIAIAAGAGACLALLLRSAVHSNPMEPSFARAPDKLQGRSSLQGLRDSLIAAVDNLPERERLIDNARSVKDILVKEYNKLR
jgi:hypothetical protein